MEVFTQSMANKPTITTETSISSRSD
jgi:hypothetical protein